MAVPLACLLPAGLRRSRARASLASSSSPPLPSTDDQTRLTLVMRLAALAHRPTASLKSSLTERSSAQGGSTTSLRPTACVPSSLSTSLSSEPRRVRVLTRSPTADRSSSWPPDLAQEPGRRRGRANGPVLRRLGRARRQAERRRRRLPAQAGRRPLLPHQHAAGARLGRDRVQLARPHAQPAQPRSLVGRLVRRRGGAHRPTRISSRRRDRLGRLGSVRPLPLARRACPGCCR